MGTRGLRVARPQVSMGGGWGISSFTLQPPGPMPAHRLGHGSVHWCFPSKGTLALVCWLKGEILAWSGTWIKPGLNDPALSPSPERAMNRACGSWLCLAPSTPSPSNNPPSDPGPLFHVKWCQLISRAVPVSARQASSPHCLGGTAGWGGLGTGLWGAMGVEHIHQLSVWVRTRGVFLSNSLPLQWGN